MVSHRETGGLGWAGGELRVEAAPPCTGWVKIRLPSPPEAASRPLWRLLREPCSAPGGTEAKEHFRIGSQPGSEGSWVSRCRARARLGLSEMCRSSIVSAGEVACRNGKLGQSFGALQPAEQGFLGSQVGVQMPKFLLCQAPKSFCGLGPSASSSALSLLP